ncbi:HNH endonuclease domain-containing protein [Hymenobacter psychrophilus]|uniref:HNH endonuclease n=1 Tax=Hymenobacter psychrophilus TaxID=651662 RepID=A0A1H3KX95_9BACT|nr:HNH endonuclease domain-containing protein [Hymenobacter psychrophilus]SDY56793.1 HNH endonuclease [Hymenobacter psychrophilus]
MSPISGDQVIATILKHDNKTTSYKIALLRALNDLALLYPGLAESGQPVAVPLTRLAELWTAYYWPFADEHQPIYQGARALVAGQVRNDVSFRPDLTELRRQWQACVQLPAQSADGFFLLTEMRTPRRRATYAPELQRTYAQAVAAAAEALRMPIRYAGPGQWSVFDKPARLSLLPAPVQALPGTNPHDTCLVVPATLWEAFQRLSLYVEALCLHEWSLFTETVTQPADQLVTRGQVYTLLTTRPDNRRPLTWERNQVDILLHENVRFTCPWTQKSLTKPEHYDLDHLLPLSLYPVNELWNLLPVDRRYNQHTKRDRVPNQQGLEAAEPLLAQAYATYQQSASLRKVMYEDSALRFSGLQPGLAFPTQLAHRAISFIGEVADARYIQRY